MKNLVKTNLIKMFFLLVALTSLSMTYAQESEQASLQKMINAKHFVFKAQTVLPLRGSTRNLTSDYDLRFSGDSLISYLPYFGRAYSAPLDPNESGLQFTSTDFTYNVQKKKKGWDITILPKDTRDVRQMFLSISNSGYARLQVTSNSRDGIAFNGYIDKMKQ
jgi:hypothetical protein